MYENDDIHFTMRRIRRQEVEMPQPPASLWGRFKWYLMPWTRPPLTLEQLRAKKLED